MAWIRSASKKVFDITVSFITRHSRPHSWTHPVCAPCSFLSLHCGVTTLCRSPSPRTPTFLHKSVSHTPPIQSSPLPLRSVSRLRLAAAGSLISHPYCLTFTIAFQTYCTPPPNTTTGSSHHSPCPFHRPFSLRILLMASHASPFLTSTIYHHPPSPPPPPRVIK